MKRHRFLTSRNSYPVCQVIYMSITDAKQAGRSIPNAQEQRSPHSPCRQCGLPYAQASLLEILCVFPWAIISFLGTAIMPIPLSPQNKHGRHSRMQENGLMQTALFGEATLIYVILVFYDCPQNRDTSAKEAFKPTLSHSESQPKLGQNRFTSRRLQMQDTAVVQKELQTRDRT